MANVKISELPLTLSVSPTALIPVVQNGTTCSTYACLIGGSSASGTSGTSGAAGAPGAAGTAGTSGGFGAVIIAGSGELSSVRDGVGNLATGDFSFAGGGQDNKSRADHSFVGGGLCNQILGASTITQTFPVTANTVNSFNVTANVTNFFPNSGTTPAPAPAIGTSYGGGVIAYYLQPGDAGYDPDVPKGLIAATADISTNAPWGCQGTLISNNEYPAQGLIGTGDSNTVGIMNECGESGIAARLCGDLDQSGFTDWYLPSKDELDKLYLNRVAIGGFETTGSAPYWTSTQLDADMAYQLFFNNGTPSADLKNNGSYVRPIRSFTWAETVPTGTDLVEAIFRGTAGTSGVTLSGWGSCYTYPTTVLTGDENIGVGPYDNVVLSFTDFGGEKSTIVAGQNNKVDGAYSFVGGAGGTVSQFGTSGSNTICQNADYSFIGAGGCNTIKPAGNVVSINQLSFVYTGSTAGNYAGVIAACATSGVGTGLNACVTFCSNVPVSVTPSMGGEGYKIGDTVTFAGSNWATPPAVGDAYGGGYVTYILQPGDAGYDAGFTKGLIVADSDQGTAYWGPSETTGATGTGLSVGAANTTLIKSVYGDLPYNTYAAGLAAAYTGGGFNDWYLPSQDELNTYYIASHTVGGISYSQNFYWSSSEVSAVDGRVQNFSDGGGGGQFDMVKSEGGMAVRAFRSFSIPSGDLTATIYEIDTVKNNAILGGFGNTIACVSNAGVFGCNLTNTQANTFMANNFVVGDLAGNAGCGVALDASGKMCLAPGAAPSPIVVGSGQYSLLGNADQGNVSSNTWSSVYGGCANRACNVGSAVFGGLNNAATGYFASIFGGSNNTIGNQGGTFATTISGGSSNTTECSYDTISGGQNNYIYGNYGTISGGQLNCIAYGQFGTIAGGCRNRLFGSYNAGPSYSFIGGGACNTVNHGVAGCVGYSAVLGGFNNCITGNYSAAFGCGITGTANCTFYVNDMCVTGTLYKTAGSFKISHPDPIKEQAGETLRHSFVESATAGDNIYRYSVTTSNGVATLELPDYYKFLNENDQVWVSPVGHFGSAYGTVNADQTAVDLVSSVDGEYNVLIIGTRKDKAAADAWKGIGS